MGTVSGAWGVVVGAVIGVGCGGGGGFDPAERGEVRTLVEPRENAMNSAFAVLSDEEGYVAVWGRSAQGEPNMGGSVFVARPGEAVHELNPTASAQRIAAIEVEGGFLVCWDSTAYFGTEPRFSGCLLLDHELEVVREWRPEYGTVDTLARVGTQLYALTWPDVTEGALELEWRALDERGDAMGAAMATPCERPRDIAFSELGVVCLVTSDPACGQQFDEPTGCTYTLEVRAPDGTLRFAVPEIAPFGSYGNTTSGRVAARDDGVLVGWSSRDDVWHAVAVDAEGTVGAPLDVPGIFAETLDAIGGGYLVTWNEYVNDPSPYRWPMMMVVDARGTTAGAAQEITGRSEELEGQGPITAVGTMGDGVGVLWEGAQDREYYPTALLFRSLGRLP